MIDSTVLTFLQPTVKSILKKINKTIYFNGALGSETVMD